MVKIVKFRDAYIFYVIALLILILIGLVVVFIASLLIYNPNMTSYEFILNMAMFLGAIWGFVVIMLIIAQLFTKTLYVFNSEGLTI